MTVRLANEIRETQSIVLCSGCFNQQPHLRHIDFDAACDRGYGYDEAVKVTMDDLILCENCVKEGAKLLGMEDSHSLKADRDDYERKWRVEKKRREQQEGYASRLEDTLGQRPEPIRIDHRKKPRERNPDLVA
jgi:hypothetical protein